MPVKRKYKVNGTKDFIIFSGIFFFLCLWAIKDAWYPSPKVIKKHPQQIEVSFNIDGAIAQWHVAKGDSVGEGQLLVELQQSKMQVDFDAAKKKYATEKEEIILLDFTLRNAKANHISDAEITTLEQRQVVAESEMDHTLEEVNVMRERMNSSGLYSPSKGVVKELLASTYSQIEQGQGVVMIDPKDHFYLFNKSLAILSFFAFWIFLGLHILSN